ncbi:amino acid ABC transporter permease [Brucella anthropi]
MFWFQVERLWNFWPILLKGLGMTVSLSLLSLIIGVIVGLIFGVLRASGNRWLSGITGLYIDLFRGTPFLVQVFICFFILPSIGIELSAFNAGVIALSNLSACFIGEIIASGIKAVPRGQTEAAIASGFTYSQQLRLIVMPQALRIVRPSLVGQFILLVKDSSVVSGHRNYGSNTLRMDDCSKHPQRSAGLWRGRHRLLYRLLSDDLSLAPYRARHTVPYFVTGQV